MQYIFTNRCIDLNNKIFFLCGTQFKHSDKSDKRNVLKRFLTQYVDGSSIIILEENFAFRSNRNNKNYLIYDDIFLSNLKDIETLTGLFVDAIFIIHESEATAAELGLFSVNNSLSNRICLLVPDDFSVEEQKIGNFMRLAFFRDSSDINKIIFYPRTEVWKTSDCKRSIHTYFQRDTIEPQQNLAKAIDDYISRLPGNLPQINYKAMTFGKPSSDNSIISYFVDDAGACTINVPARTLKTQIIALFFVDEIKSKIRIDQRIKDHVSAFEDQYNKITKKTIETITGRRITSMSIDIQDSNVKYRTAIAYCLYLLQAMGLISFVNSDENRMYIRKISVANRFRELFDKYQDFISEISPSLYERRVK